MKQSSPLTKLIFFPFLLVWFSCLSQTPATGLHFDGVNDYVQTTLPGNSYHSWTLCAWVKPELLQDFGDPNNHSGIGHTIINADTLGFSGTGIGIDANEVRVIYDFAFVPENSFPYSFVVGNWYHIAVVFDYIQGQISAYVNGALINTVNASFSAGTISNFYIGYSPNVWNSPFKGMIDEARVYDTILTQQQIIGLLNCAVPQAGLLAYYSFSNGYANSVNTGNNILPDASGHGYTGTLQNFALNGNTSNWTLGRPNCSLYFRSLQTGDWNNSTTWESSPVDSFSLALQSPALVTPNKDNANDVTIRKGNVVTVTGNESSRQVHVRSELKINVGGKLDVLP